jgi:hypothetical protein
MDGATLSIDIRSCLCNESDNVVGTTSYEYRRRTRKPGASRAASAVAFFEPRVGFSAGGSVEDRSKATGQFLRQTRLHEDRAAAGALGSLAHRTLCSCREHDDWDVARPRVTFQIFHEMPTVKIWQMRLGDDDVRMRLPRALERLRPVADGHRFETEDRKCRRIQLKRVVVTIYDEHKRSARRGPETAAFHGGPRSEYIFDPVAGAVCKVPYT